MEDRVSCFTKKYFYINFLLYFFIINISNISYKSVASEDSYRDTTSSDCCCSCIPRILSFLPFLSHNKNIDLDKKRLLPRNNKKKSTYILTMPVSTNHMRRLPPALQEHAVDFLQPSDALVLLLVARPFGTILNEDFWKRYSDKRSYENWSPTTIPWRRVAVACSWYNEGKGPAVFSLTDSLIGKAARLGHPKARSDIEIIEGEIIRRRKAEREIDRKPSGTYIPPSSEAHRYYPIPFSTSSHVGSLIHYARSSSRSSYR
jgi:hypothetical protein